MEIGFHTPPHNPAAKQAIREPKEWREIPDWPDYEVSDTGLLLSYKRKNPRILIGAVNNYGYIAYVLYKDGEKRHIYAHEIVLELWKGDRPEGMWGRHKDNNKGNNAIDNLEWASPTRCNKNRQEFGTMYRGEKHHFSRLNERLVGKIRREHKEGDSYDVLAKRYNLSTHHVYRICRGKNWAPLAINKKRNDF